MSDGPGPFRYEARAAYALSAGALTIRLSVRNLAPDPLPFGLGFHPWIVRSAWTQLKAKAARVVLENNDHLPAGEAPAASRPEWDFAAPRALPSRWINNAFLGWDGQAEVLWPERNLKLEIDADPLLSTYVVYSPSAEAGFFCSSRSPIPSTRITCRAARRPMAWRSSRRGRPGGRLPVSPAGARDPPLS